VPAFVTGIAQSQDVAGLENILGGIAGVDRSKLVVITSADRTDEHDDSFINFVHAATGGEEMITGGEGTTVPGINDNGLGYLSHPHVIQHVGNLPIPDDEADNYNDAIDNGRAVVAYPANGNAASIEAGFKAAGLSHVKTF
jgi:hypothetical protein